MWLAFRPVPSKLADRIPLEHVLGPSGPPPKKNNSWKWWPCYKKRNLKSKHHILHQGEKWWKMVIFPSIIFSRSIFDFFNRIKSSRSAIFVHRRLHSPFTWPWKHLNLSIGPSHWGCWPNIQDRCSLVEAVETTEEFFTQMKHGYHQKSWNINAITTTSHLERTVYNINKLSMYTCKVTIL